MKKIILSLFLITSLGVNAQILNVKSTTKVDVPTEVKVSTAQLSPDGKWVLTN